MNKSIRLKLVLAFNLFLLALAITGYFTYRQLDRSRDLSASIRSQLNARVEHSGHLGWQLDRLRSLELAYILAHDQQVADNLAATFPPLAQDMETHFAGFQATFGNESPSQGLAQMQSGYRTYMSTHEQLVSLVQQGRQQEALALYGSSNADFQDIEERAHALFHESHGETQSAADTVGSLLGRLQYLILGGLVAAALLIVVVGHPLATGLHRRLQALLDGMKRVSRGELDHSMAVKGNDEIAEVSRAFNSMIGSLRSARDEVSELHGRALAMHEERIALLQGRVGQVVKAQEEERRRVARELHDQAGQVLTALQLRLSRLQIQAPTPEVEQQAASLREMALEAMTEVRNLALDLRPSALDELGLVGALTDYVSTYSSRTNVPAKLHVYGAQRRLPAEAEVTLFRIAQEGLTNAAKHSKASQVSVSLAFSNPGIGLIVEDNGAGFDVDRALGPEQYKSLGLLGIQERCNLISAGFRIVSQPGGGTRLMVQLQEEAEKKRGAGANEAGTQPAA